MEYGFLPSYAAAPCASDSSVSSPPPLNPRGVGTMHAGDGGRLPGAGARGVLHHAPWDAGARGEPRPWDDARRWTGAGVRRHPLRPNAASEIEELPPSPPPPSSRFLAPNAAAAAAAAGAGLAGLEAELEIKEVELAAMASRMQLLCRELASPRCPRRQDAGEVAEIEMLERKVGTMRDGLVALRLQQKEMQALMESPEAWERKNSSKIGGTCNWNHIISVIALASGSVLLIVFRTLPPLRYLTHTIGAIGVLWILGSFDICRQMYGESMTRKGCSRRVAQFMCMCFLLLALFDMCLISRLVLLLYRFDR
ncbi:unnamed protein product [Urochloa decumbens]|uniref:Uncharacterized protein n=1 Tax=Urochloa decumbens TaxID=240449 RepID=A0ABC9FNP4_9POAL